MNQDLKVNFKPLSLVWLITINSLLAYLAIRYYQIPDKIIVINNSLSLSKTQFLFVLLVIWAGLMTLVKLAKNFTVQKPYYKLLRKEAILLTIAFVVWVLISSELIIFQSINQTDASDQLNLLFFAFVGYSIIWIIKFKYKISHLSTVSN